MAAAMSCKRFQKLFMVVWWNLMNPQGNEWDLLCSQNTKITLQAKVLLRWPITIWLTSLFSGPSDENTELQKLQWTRNGKISRQSQHGNQKRSRVNVILEAKRDIKVHFATLMDMCHFEKRGARTQITHVHGQSRIPQ